MSMHIPGSCGCGQIKFTVTAAKANVVNCHCTVCRKLNGGVFSTYFVVAKKRFSLLEGESFLAEFAISENAARHFCRSCGAPIFNRNLKYPNLHMIHLGALNLTEEVTPNVNIFCQSKFSWVAFNCEIINFAKEIE